MNFNLNDKIKIIQEAIPDVTPADLTIYLRSIYIYECKRKNHNQKESICVTFVLFQNKSRHIFIEKICK
jgi:hypothetical protein